MNTHSPLPTECFLDPKDLEQPILKLRQFAQSLDEEAGDGYISDVADEACLMDQEH